MARHLFHGRIRLSTVLLAALFLAALGTYFLVRPVPASIAHNSPPPSPSAPPSLSPSPSPSRVSPRPSTVSPRPSGSTSRPRRSGGTPVPAESVPAADSVPPPS